MTIEPPPTSSGLGTLWGKLSMGAVTEGFAIDYLGPDADRCSNHGRSGLPTTGRLFDLGDPPLSRVSSIRRNTTSGAKRLGWNLLRTPFAILERQTGRSLYVEWMQRRVEEELPRILAEERFDAVAAKVPPLTIAAAVKRAAAKAGTPFATIMGDPIGYRDEAGGFAPSNAVLQQELIDGGAAFVTRRSAYERYYAKTFRIDPGRVAFFEDSFIPLGTLEEAAPALDVGERTVLHFGQIDSWRPMDTLVEALKRVNASLSDRGDSPLTLALMGRITDEPMRARVVRQLGAFYREIPARPYREARAIARTARRFVVIVSSRHRENIPSKLIDTLAYGRPTLLLAHPDSASAEEVRRLGAGIVADIRDVESVTRGLTELDARREGLEPGCSPDALAEAWGFRSVGERFRVQLFRAMGW